MTQRPSRFQKDALKKTFAERRAQKDALKKTASASEERLRTGAWGSVPVGYAIAALPKAQVAVRTPGSGWRSAPFRGVASRPFNRFISRI
jgi:hypothetical protein